MINLFINYFVSKEPKRQAEYITCIKKNLLNPALNKIYVFAEGNTADTLESNNQKLIIKNNCKRMTYFDFIKEINAVTLPHDINIIANLDVYFDASVVLAVNMKLKTVYALTRDDMLIPKKPINHPDSQDAWIFKGNIPNSQSYQIHLGTAGCDNAIADRFERNGMEILNPALSIKVFHVHKSEIRTYSITKRCHKPYLLIIPHLINEKSKKKYPVT